MEEGIVWRCPVTSEVASASVVSAVVQSGIKLFLHQRNQIPLPLEQLATKKKLISSNSSSHSHLENPPTTTTTPAPISHPFDPTSTLVSGAQDEIQNPRHRIQSIVSQRKREQVHQKRMKAQGKLTRREENALISINTALKTVDFLIKSHSHEILAVGLFFGASITSAKEAILFHLPRPRTSQSGLSSKSSSDISDGDNGDNTASSSTTTTLIRNFYKSIIMTDGFVDFTEKNLQPTRTHICILSPNEFRTSESESSNSDSLKMIELDEGHFLSELFMKKSPKDEARDDVDVSTQSQSQHFPNPHRRRNRKVLQVKIHVDVEVEKNESDVSLNSECLSSGLFCYQIPFTLKGISCKKNVW